MNPKVIHRALQCEQNSSAELQNTREGKHESRTLKIALELFIESQSHLLSNTSPQLSNTCSLLQYTELLGCMHLYMLSAARIFYSVASGMLIQLWVML